jgi:hypothetical protein
VWTEIGTPKILSMRLSLHRGCGWDRRNDRA